VINYRKDRFETITRKLTNKKGVDVVFEHVGGERLSTARCWCSKRGGRLVTCGSTAAPSIQFNLNAALSAAVQNFGSFGATMRKHPR